jgi:hypothetical protein
MEIDNKRARLPKTIGNTLFAVAIVFALINLGGMLWLLLRNAGEVVVPIGEKIIRMRRFIAISLCVDIAMFIPAAVCFYLSRSAGRSGDTNL